MITGDEKCPQSTRKGDSGWGEADTPGNSCGVEPTGPGHGLRVVAWQMYAEERTLTSDPQGSVGHGRGHGEKNRLPLGHVSLNFYFLGYADMNNLFDISQAGPPWPSRSPHLSPFPADQGHSFP